MPKPARNATKTAPAKPSTPAPAPRHTTAPAAAVEAKSARAGSTPRSVTHDEIARAAFLRWQKFGGDPETNWHAAERELRGV